MHCAHTSRRQRRRDDAYGSMRACMEQAGAPKRRKVTTRRKRNERNTYARTTKTRSNHGACTAAVSVCTCGPALMLFFPRVFSRFLHACMYVSSSVVVVASLLACCFHRCPVGVDLLHCASCKTKPPIYPDEKKQKKKVALHSLSSGS
jgi:hypothetical protein